MSTHGRAVKERRRKGRRNTLLKKHARQLHAYARTTGPTMRLQGAGDPIRTQRFKVVAYRNSTPQRTFVVFESDDEATAVAFCERFPTHLRANDKTIPAGSYLVLRDNETKTKKRFDL